MARTFNGTTDICSLGTCGDAILKENAAITVSAWINPTTVGENSGGRILDRGASGLVTGPTFSTAATATLRFSVTAATTNLVRQASNSVITTSAWQHVILTWDGSGTAANVHFYVNGTEPSYATTTDMVGSPTDNSAASLLIGNNPAATRTFNGGIAEVATWSAVLGAQEIAILASGYTAGHVRPDILTGYWPLYGTSSPEPDVSGFNNHGTLTGTARLDHPPVTQHPFSRPRRVWFTPAAAAGSKGPLVHSFLLNGLCDGRLVA